MRKLSSGLAIGILLCGAWALAADSLTSLRQAALAGDPDASYRLGNIYQAGTSQIPSNLAEAVRWLSVAASAGHTDAQRELAMLHLRGRGVPQSFEKAEQLRVTAAQKNDSEAQYRLAQLLLDERSGESNLQDALSWLSRAAEAGNPGAQLTLGELYLEGEAIPLDVDQGLKWVHSAAEQSHPKSLGRLARLYESGSFVPENAERARHYFSASAAAGLPEAQVWMAEWHERQQPPEYQHALRLYRLAARQDSADGHFGVARLNIERRLLTPNAADGLKHLRAAVRLNHPEAHYMIGRMYGDGRLRGGAVRALEHFQNASNLGYAPAMHELAVAYYRGTPPLKKNLASAAAWWRRAAAAGHVESQYAFALMHLRGTGVQKNTGVGFALVNVAAAQGHKEAIRVRDELLSSLPPELLRDAQDLSVTMFEQYAAGTDPGVRAQLK